MAFPGRGKALSRVAGIALLALGMACWPGREAGSGIARSALALLPSDREGFGLPIVEALACATPMVASDIPVLREIGSTAVTYCPVASVEAWVEAILRLLDEREQQPAAWQARRAAGLARASEFSWSNYAAAVAARYRAIAGVAPVEQRA